MDLSVAVVQAIPLVILALLRPKTLEQLVVIWLALRRREG
jgi:hypothetical protein